MPAARVIVIGDAISRGSNRDAAGALPATIMPSWRYWLWQTLRERGRDVDFVGPQTYPDFPDPPWTFDQDNCAYGGATTTAWMLEKVRSVAASGIAAPDVALVMIGLEDAYKQFPVETRIANVKTIITELRGWYLKDRGSRGMAIIISTLLKTTDGVNGSYRYQTQIAPFNTALQAMATEITTPTEPVVCIDIHSGWTEAHNDETGRKPSTLGEQTIAAAFCEPLLVVLDTIRPVDPDPDPDPDPDVPVYGPTVQAEISADRQHGTAPLMVQFTDRSAVDRKRMHRAVVVLPGVDATFAKRVLAMIPTSMFDLTVIPAVEGQNWKMDEVYTPDRNYIPWPITRDTVVISRHSMAGVDWKCGACANAEGKVSLPIYDDHYAAGNYESTGQILLHELLHTVPGLESSDAMRSSPGFLAWLDAHPSEIGAGFAADPAQYPATEPILGLYYLYLVETYMASPTLHSGQISYAWDFGDSTIATTRSPLHVYANDGEFPVTLTVSSPWGTSTSEPMTVVVYPEVVAPTARIWASSTTGDAPLGIQFRDASLGGTPTAWHWDFGDGATSTMQHPTHVYTVPDVYSVTLTATNPGGSDTVTNTNFIMVTRPPAPAAPVHELSPAGYLDLLDMLAEGIKWAELRDGAGAAVGSRFSTAGRVTWTVDPITLVARFRLDIQGTDAPWHPLTVSGVALYEQVSGGEPLTVQRFADAPPILRRDADTITLTVHLNVLADTAVPRIANLTTVNVSGEIGTAMIIRFRVEHVRPGWTIVLDEVSPVVLAGSLARVSFRVVKNG